jgi:O-antigen/teichoic acid export membrane protein
MRHNASALLESVKRLFHPEHRPIMFNFLNVMTLRGMQLILSFATAYFMVRALTKEQFGEYHYILGWIGVLTIFALPGLLDSAMQGISRGKMGTFFPAAKLMFFCSLLGSVALLVCGGWFLYGNDTEMAAGFAVAALLFPLMHGLTAWKTVRHGQQDFKMLLKVEGTNSIIMSLLLIFCLTQFPQNLILPLLIVMGIPALMNITQTWRHYRDIPKDSEVEKGNIAYGIKTTLYSTLSVLGNHIDKLLLFGFLSPVALATYMAAQKLTEPVQGITQDLAAVLAPRFAKYTHLTKNLDRAFWLFSAAMGAGIVAFSFTLLPWIFILIFGEQYRDSIPYCQALMCTLVIGNVASLRFRFIRSRMSLESVRNITFVNSIFRIIFSLCLIPSYGIEGAILSNILTKILMNIQIHYDIKKFREDYNAEPS